MHGVVCNVAHAAAVEGRQAFDRDQSERVHLGLHQGEWINLAGWLVCAGAEHVVRLGADEAVAADAFAAGHRFQQEGVRRAGDLQVRRNGSLQVGVDGAVDRTQIALARHGLDLFQRGVVVAWHVKSDSVR